MCNSVEDVSGDSFMCNSVYEDVPANNVIIKVQPTCQKISVIPLQQTMNFVTTVLVYSRRAAFTN